MSSANALTPRSDETAPTEISRREALRRVGVILGGTVSTSTVSALLAGCSGRTFAGGPYTACAVDYAVNQIQRGELRV